MLLVQMCNNSEGLLDSGKCLVNFELVQCFSLLIRTKCYIKIVFYYYLLLTKSLINRAYCNKLHVVKYLYYISSFVYFIMLMEFIGYILIIIQTRRFIIYFHWWEEHVCLTDCQAHLFSECSVSCSNSLWITFLVSILELLISWAIASSNRLTYWNHTPMMTSSY